MSHPNVVSLLQSCVTRERFSIFERWIFRWLVALLLNLGLQTQGFYLGLETMSRLCSYRRGKDEVEVAYAKVKFLCRPKLSF